MKPYLCGAINGCSDSEAKDWRAFAMLMFPQAINPMVRDYRGKEMSAYREIVELDKLDIRRCDCLLVNYGGASVGTAMEIFYAHSLGLPVVLMNRTSQPLSPWLIYHSTVIVSNMNDAVNAVKRVCQ